MENRIEEIKRDLALELENVNDSKALYELKTKYVLNKVGIIPALMQGFKGGQAKARSDYKRVKGLGNRNFSGKGKGY